MMPMTVLSCPYLFLDPAPRSNDWTDFHDLWLKRRVPNTNTNTGSDVICCTDSLQITNKTILKINISKIIMSKVFKIPNVTKTNLLISIYHPPMAETVVAIARDTACAGRPDVLV